MTSSDPAAPASPPPVTLRVTFAYHGRVVSLVGSRRVAMIAPPSVTPTPTPGQSGYWFELRGVADELLYHRALSNLIRTDVEVFAEDARQTIARVPIANPEGRFEVLVPDLSEARTFHFYGTPAGAPSESAPSAELFRADVDELRKARTEAPPPGSPSPPRGNAAR